MLLDGGPRSGDKQQVGLHAVGVRQNDIDAQGQELSEQIGQLRERMRTSRGGRSAKILTMHHVYAPRRDSELTCQAPNCQGHLVKTDYPTHPMPEVPQNGALLTTAFGSAFCENCGELHSWVYGVMVPTPPPPRRLAAAAVG